MLVLALDTTTRQGSVALARDGALVAVYAGDAGTTHGERLPGDALKVSAAQGLRVADVELFAVASGPGSFTGLRIGIATMQGLALANGKPLVGISALDALSALVTSLSPHPAAVSPDREVCTWTDAQRGQVFSAVYGTAWRPRARSLKSRPTFSRAGGVTGGCRACSRVMVRWRIAS